MQTVAVNGLLSKMFNDFSPKILQEILPKMLQEMLQETLPKMLQEILQETTRDELPPLLGLTPPSSRQAPEQLGPDQRPLLNSLDTLLNKLLVAYVGPRLESVIREESSDRIERLEDTIEVAVEKVTNEINEAVETVKSICYEEREEAVYELSRHRNTLFEELETTGLEVIDKAEDKLGVLKQNMEDDTLDFLESNLKGMVLMFLKRRQAQTLRFVHQRHDAEAGSEATTEDESSFESAVRSSKPAENSKFF